MKVLYVWHGAVEKEYRKIFSEFVKRGVNLVVITANRWFEAAKFQSFEFCETDKDYEIYPLATVFTNHIRAFFYLNKFKIIKILLRHKPDIIYIKEEPYSTASFMLIVLTKMFSPKSKIMIESDENIFKSHPFPFNVFEKFSLGNIDALCVVPTEGIELYHRKGFKGKIFKVSYFVDVDKFFEVPKEEVVKKIPELSFDGLKVGFVGRISEEKGIDTAIEAIKYLKDKGKDKIRFFVVGKETPEYFSFLKSKIEEYSLEDNVKFLGHFGYDKLLYFYNGIDCLVLPSRTKSWWKEQFGRVIVESMACGTPVIGSDSGEIPIVIDNPELTFKEDDYIGLANILEKFCDGVLEKDKLSDSLMEKSRKYTVEEVVKNKVEIFKKILQQ
jgi:glycosyltransferase involved in cell wall biosynthesis